MLQSAITAINLASSVVTIFRSVSDWLRFQQFHINLTQWRGEKSRNFMQDLIEAGRHGSVALQSDRHGKCQPQALVRVLRRKQLEEIAKRIKRVSGEPRRHRLDIPKWRLKYTPHR